MSWKSDIYKNATLLLLIIAALASLAGIGIASQQVFISSDVHSLTKQILEHQTKPAKLIFEITEGSNTTYLNHQTKSFHLSGLHSIETEKINVSVWNVGPQTAQDVSIRIKLEPQHASLYDSYNHQKCIGLACISYTSNPVEFKAIESNGFYSMKTTLDFFTQQIKNSSDSVYMVIEISYFDSKTTQKLQEKYQITVD